MMGSLVWMPSRSRLIGSLSSKPPLSTIAEIVGNVPDAFAISVCTADGQLFHAGDVEAAFTIQSIAKPFTYGMGLDDHGRDYVLSRVGVEPTGDAFNSITLDEASKRPYNPMVNAGAIAMASMIKGASPTERLNRVLEAFGRYMGRKAAVDVSVYMSEKTTGHRNRAIAHLMLNFGMLDSHVDEALDLYFQQCAMLVTSRDLAVMAASLANGGYVPERVAA